MSRLCLDIFCGLRTKQFCVRGRGDPRVMQPLRNNNWRDVQPSERTIRRPNPFEKTYFNTIGLYSGRGDYLKCIFGPCKGEKGDIFYIAYDRCARLQDVFHLPFPQYTLYFPLVVGGKFLSNVTML